MTEQTIRENRIKKMTQASAKFLALKAGFATSAAKWPLAPLRGDVEKRALEARADFEEANRIWNETAKSFKWWQSLP